MFWSLIGLSILNGIWQPSLLIPLPDVTHFVTYIHVSNFEPKLKKRINETRRHARERERDGRDQEREEPENRTTTVQGKRCVTRTTSNALNYIARQRSP